MGQRASKAVVNRESGGTKRAFTRFIALVALVNGMS